MTLKEAICKINKSDAFKDKVYISEFAEAVNVQNCNNWDDQDRLTCYFLLDWHCTDSRVGMRVYFLDGEPVAVSKQLGRKLDEEFAWVSKTAYFNTKTYVKSFVEPEEEDSVDLLNIDETITDGYQIAYSSQLYPHHKKSAIAPTNGTQIPVEIIDTKEFGNDENKVFIPDQCKVRYANGTEKWIETDKLMFAFNLTVPN